MLKLFCKHAVRWLNMRRAHGKRDINVELGHFLTFVKCGSSELHAHRAEWVKQEHVMRWRLAVGNIEVDRLLGGMFVRSDTRFHLWETFAGYRGYGQGLGNLLNTPVVVRQLPMQGHGRWVLRSPGVGRTGGSVWVWVVQDLLPDRQREDFVCSDSFIPIITDTFVKML